MLSSLPQTIANAGIGDTPLSSSVTPDTAGEPGHIISSDNEELNSGEEKNAPISKFNILLSNTEIVAGFHCNAPLISNGCAVEAPPIDILTAPTPCIICPACAKVAVVKSITTSLNKFLMILNLI